MLQGASPSLVPLPNPSGLLLPLFKSARTLRLVFGETALQLLKCCCNDPWTHGCSRIKRIFFSSSKGRMNNVLELEKKYVIIIIMTNNKK